MVSSRIWVWPLTLNHLKSRRTYAHLEILKQLHRLRLLGGDLFTGISVPSMQLGTPSLAEE